MLTYFAWNYCHSYTLWQTCTNNVLVLPKSSQLNGFSTPQIDLSLVFQMDFLSFLFAYSDKFALCMWFKYGLVNLDILHIIIKKWVFLTCFLSNISHPYFIDTYITITETSLTHTYHNNNGALK